MILKQKSFWILVICCVMAAEFALIGSLLHPSVKAIDNVETCLNEKNIKGIVNSYAPADRIAISAMIELADGIMGEIFNIQEIFPEMQSSIGNHYNLIYNEPVKNEEGTSTMLFYLYNQGEKCIGVDVSRIDLIDLNGNLYLQKKGVNHFFRGIATT